MTNVLFLVSALMVASCVAIVSRPVHQGQEQRQRPQATQQQTQHQASSYQVQASAERNDGYRGLLSLRSRISANAQRGDHDDAAALASRLYSSSSMKAAYATTAVYRQIIYPDEIETTTMEFDNRIALGGIQRQLVRPKTQRPYKNYKMQN